MAKHTVIDSKVAFVKGVTSQERHLLGRARNRCCLSAVSLLNKAGFRLMSASSDGETNGVFCRIVQWIRGFRVAGWKPRVGGFRRITSPGAAIPAFLSNLEEIAPALAVRRCLLVACSPDGMFHT